MVPVTPEQLFARCDVPTAPALRLMEQLSADAPPDWRALSAALALRMADGGTRIFGVSGGQGAGKSTLSMLLEAAFAHSGIRLLVLSLDDFYLTRTQRAELGRERHPLLATRGVPGSHDVPALQEALESVFQPGVHLLPRFDKGRDDRAPEPARFAGPADMVVLEGWCVGATPQPEGLLATPVNTLEAEQDSAGVWRRYVNDALAGPYRSLFARLERLLYLAVPDLEAVIRWRSQQELQRPEAQRMSDPAIREFVEHYQRLTEWMLQTVVDTADFVGFLDANHRLAGFRCQ